MQRPRVLVVDDSVVVRRLVSKALEAEDEVEVVGVAADGKIALANIEQLHPDVVILDVEMPVMDGLTALAEIRQRWPGLPVIMFSTLTSRGAEVTLDALALGASDYVLKPSSSDPASSMAQIRADLLPRIAALLPQAKEARERTATRGAAAPARGSPARSGVPPDRSSASTSSRSGSRPAGRPPWRSSSRRCPAASPCRSRSCSTCRRCSPGSSPSGSTTRARSRVREGADGAHLDAGHRLHRAGRPAHGRRQPLRAAPSSTGRTRTRAGPRSIRCSAPSPSSSGRTRSPSC